MITYLYKNRWLYLLYSTMASVLAIYHNSDQTYQSVWIKSFLVMFVISLFLDGYKVLLIWQIETKKDVADDATEFKPEPREDSDDSNNQE